MKNLTQLPNKLEIIGTLRSKDLEQRTSMNGDEYISGSVIITSKIDNVIHDFLVKVFTMNTQRSARTFKGIQAVFNEYKSVEEHGEEHADTIKVTGSLKFVQYENRNNELKEYNEIKGNFFTRLSRGIDDMAILEIGTVVEGFSHDENGKVTVKGFNVAYNEEVVTLKDMFVKEKISETFKNLYYPLQTGRLVCNLICPKITKKSVHGFGANIAIESNIIETNNLSIEVIGGDLPYTDNKKYDEEMIKHSKEKLQKKLEESRRSLYSSSIASASGF
ncbi:hypothetical protein [Cytobacillus gottheilii]|uniref:hypothetical protein n=1 Tax=Cytobacillus gottheilii TaxID=859144 RepID=UPI0008335A1E|nr:hypothetical protein [Cytobacillus gottheilii]